MGKINMFNSEPACKETGFALFLFFVHIFFLYSARPRTDSGCCADVHIPPRVMR